MKRPVSLFLLVSFVLWILPLGVFIKPCQEKLLCDGQRAMCMCCMMKPKASDKAMEAGIVLKAGASSNKENPSGGSNSFLSAKPVLALKSPFESFSVDQHFSYKTPFLAAVEYVPKV